MAAQPVTTRATVNVGSMVLTVAGQTYTLDQEATTGSLAALLRLNGWELAGRWAIDNLIMTVQVRRSGR